MGEGGGDLNNRFIFDFLPIFQIVWTGCNVETVEYNNANLLIYDFTDAQLVPLTIFINFFYVFFGGGCPSSS